MSDYSVDRVNNFTAKLQELDDDHLVQCWARMCGWAEDLNMVLVQPDKYIAGHIIDRYTDIHGENSARKNGR